MGDTPWVAKRQTRLSRQQCRAERERDYSASCTSAYVKPLYILIHLFLSTVLRGRQYYCHFVNEEGEEQTG